METSEILATYGVTTEQAKNWILSNTSSPELILSTAKNVGLTSRMLAEILQPDLPNITDLAVDRFFEQSGIDPSDISERNTEPFTYFLPDELIDLTALISTNPHTGDLSTTNLRNKAIQAITDMYPSIEAPEQAYWNFFKSVTYDADGSGFIRSSELGADAPLLISSSPEAIEELFFGTILEMQSRLDISEFGQYAALATVYDWTDEEAMSDYYSTLTAILEDRAQTPLNSPEDAALNADGLAAQVAIAVVGSQQNWPGLVGTSGSQLDSSFALGLTF